MFVHTRITRGQVPSVTKKILKLQNNICPLCKQRIDLTKPRSYALDHSHETGLIRGVLHSSCNSAEGRVRHFVGRFGAKQEKYSYIIPWLQNLIEYLNQEPHPYLHYTHSSEEEKRIHKKVQAQKRRAAKKAEKELKK